jgi:hypothetical protein
MGFFGSSMTVEFMASVKPRGIPSDHEVVQEVAPFRGSRIEDLRVPRRCYGNLFDHTFTIVKKREGHQEVTPPKGGHTLKILSFLCY